MSIYRRLNPRLLVEVEVGLGLLHWINMLIYLLHIPVNNRYSLLEQLVAIKRSFNLKLEKQFKV